MEFLRSIETRVAVAEGRVYLFYIFCCHNCRCIFPVFHRAHNFPHHWGNKILVCHHKFLLLYVDENCFLSSVIGLVQLQTQAYLIEITWSIVTRSSLMYCLHETPLSQQVMPHNPIDKLNFEKGTSTLQLGLPLTFCPTLREFDSSCVVWHRVAVSRLDHDSGFLALAHLLNATPETVRYLWVAKSHLERLSQRHEDFTLFNVVFSVFLPLSRDARPSHPFRQMSVHLMRLFLLQFTSLINRADVNSAYFLCELLLLDPHRIRECRRWLYLLFFLVLLKSWGSFLLLFNLLYSSNFFLCLFLFGQIPLNRHSDDKWPTWLAKVCTNFQNLLDDLSFLDNCDSVSDLILWWFTITIKIVMWFFLFLTTHRFKRSIQILLLCRLYFFFDCFWVWLFRLDTLFLFFCCFHYAAIILL